jgi:hypothetical protein
LVVLGDDAVHQALVQFGAAVDADGSTASCGDCLHQSCVGRAHSLDFSKAFKNPAEWGVNRWKWDVYRVETGVAGSIPFRQICFSAAAIRSNLLFNGLSKNRA